MRSFIRVALPLLAATLLSGCEAFKDAQQEKATRRLKQYASELYAAAPVAADTAGKYPASAELSILDGLLQKYPGRQVTRTVTKIREVPVPGKTLYVPIAAKPDTAANRVERDSLLKEMVRLTENEKRDHPGPASGALQQEVARLKARLLMAFNRRGCLPDTTVYFPKDSASFTIKRVDDTHYLFTCTVAPRTIRVPVEVVTNENKRVAQDTRVYWQFWQFWAALAGWGLAGFFTVQALRGRNG